MLDSLIIQNLLINDYKANYKNIHVTKKKRERKFDNYPILAAITYEEQLSSFGICTINKIKYFFNVSQIDAPIFDPINLVSPQNYFLLIEY